MGLLVSRTSGNSANRPTLPPSMDSIKTKTRKKHRVRLPSSSRSSFHHDRTRTAGLHAEQFRNISSAVPSAPCTVRMLCRVVSSSPPLFLPRFETCRTVTLSSLSPLSILVATADRSPHPPSFSSSPPGIRRQASHDPVGAIIIAGAVPCRLRSSRLQLSLLHRAILSLGSHRTRSPTASFLLPHGRPSLLLQSRHIAIVVSLLGMCATHSSCVAHSFHLPIPVKRSMSIGSDRSLFSFIPKPYFLQ